MKKPPRKPAGMIGPIRMRLADKSAEFTPIRFPKDKAERERYIVTFVTQGILKRGDDPYQLTGNPVQNPESDFDFTLPTVAGTEYLDLMEIAPLDTVAGSYADAPGSYNHGEMADFICEKVLGKSRKYRAKPQPPIHLLLYSTDWRFRVGDGVLIIVAHCLARGDHGFKTVLYFVPDDETHGQAKRVYPLPPETFKSFDEQAARHRRTLIGNPLQMQVESTGAIVIPLSPPTSKRRDR